MLRFLWRVTPLLGLLLPVALVAQERPAAAGSICRSTDRPAGRVIEGTVLDLLTLSPLGSADVMLRSTVGLGVRILGNARSAADGSYTFCGVPDLAGLNVTGKLMADSSRSVPVPDDPFAPVPPIYIRWSEPADIAGRVLDVATGEPLEGVLIELDGRAVRSYTDDEGAFRILGQGAGRFILRTSRVGYLTRTDSVDVASRDSLDVEIHLSTQAVELDPVVVRVRSTLERERRSSASRFEFMTTAAIDSLLPRARTFVDLLRGARFAGIKIQHGGGGVCIDLTRDPGCNMLTVIVNGARLVDPGQGLLDIVPESVASFQLLDPMEATIRFGSTDIQHGVLVITLR